MIRDFSRLVIRRVCKSEYRSKLGAFALEVRQDFLIALICLDLAHLSCLEPFRDLVEIALLVALEGVFELSA